MHLVSSVLGYVRAPASGRFRLLAGAPLLALMSGGPGPVAHADVAWPHRAWVTSAMERPATFRAYTLGGTLVTPAEQQPRSIFGYPEVRILTERDTIRGTAPKEFALDLGNGPVVFVAEEGDSLQLVVGRNPAGSLNQVKATGRRFTVRLVADSFVIDRR